MRFVLWHVLTQILRTILKRPLELLFFVSTVMLGVHRPNQSAGHLLAVIL
jgi:hypothetical protein